MWFGEHEGITFDELEDGYVMSLVNMYSKEGDAAGQDARFQNVSLIPIPEISNTSQYFQLDKKV